MVQECVKVTNCVHLLLPHSCCTGKHFLVEFHYVGHMSYNKIEHWSTRTRKSLLKILHFNFYIGHAKRYGGFQHWSQKHKKNVIWNWKVFKKFLSYNSFIIPVNKWIYLLIHYIFVEVISFYQLSYGFLMPSAFVDSLLTPFKI